MNNGIQPAELHFFSLLARCSSLSAAARELGVSTAAVSKRLAQLESRLGVPLLNRTGRRMSLTAEGKFFLERAQHILDELEALNELLGDSRTGPRGLLRINASLGFGRRHIAPIISRYCARYPEVEIQLQLSANPPPLTDDAFDICIRFGAPDDARVIARRLFPNRRILCAAPAYLAQHGTPQTPADLRRHACIIIRQGEDAYGTWRLTPTDDPDSAPCAVKVKGRLATNDGEVAVQWALAGHGIVMRAEWDVREHLDKGRLVHVLTGYQTPDADIYVLYPQRHRLSRRIRSFVDELQASTGTPIRAARS